MKRPPAAVVSFLIAALLLLLSIVTFSALAAREPRTGRGALRALNRNPIQLKGFAKSPIQQLSTAPTCSADTFAVIYKLVDELVDASPVEARVIIEELEGLLIPEALFGCIVFTQTALEGEMTAVSIIANTTHCADGNPATDPCCYGGEASFSQCCAPREKSITVPVPASPNTTFIEAQCGNPSDVTKLFDRYSNAAIAFNGLILGAIPKCVEGMMDTPAGYEELLSCLYLEKATCEAHDECPSGKCNLQWMTCEDPEPSPALYTTIAQCIIDNLSDADGTLEKFVRFAGKSTTGLSTVSQIVEDELFKERCVGYGGWDKTDKASCEAEKVCNDGTEGECDSSSPPSFCGSGCDATTGVCWSDYTWLSDKESCENSNACLGFIRGHKKQFADSDKATCESIEYCTSCEIGVDGCTTASCSDHHYCDGFPFEEAACIVPYDFSKDYGICDEDSYRTMIGCKSHSFLTQQDCTANGGTWTEVPTTAEECHSFKGCVEYGVGTDREVSGKSESECAECGSKFETLFQWKQGVMRHPVYFPENEWKEREMVSRNQWAKDRNGALLSNFMRFHHTPEYYRDLIFCAYGEMMKFSSVVACDCGDEKGENCFDGAFDNVLISKFRSKQGVAKTVYANGVRIHLDSSSVPAGTPEKDIAVYKHILLDHPKTRVMVTEGSKIVGQVVGDGLKLDTKLSHATICVSKIEGVVITNPDFFTEPSFATRDSSGSYSVSKDVTAYTSGSDFICAKFTGDQTTTTFFPIMKIPEPSPEPTPSPSPRPSDDEVSGAIGLNPTFQALIAAAAAAAVAVMAL